MPTAAAPTPHLAYCGGSFGRVSLMAADTVLADHARDCAQLLVNVHTSELQVRVDGATRQLRPFEATLIERRQVYAITPAQATPRLHAPHGEQHADLQHPGFLLVKAGANTDWQSGTRHTLRGQAAQISLPAAARDDAGQLVAHLLKEIPEPAVLEQGVRALQDAAFERLAPIAPPRSRASARHASVLAGIEALHDLGHFGPVRRHAAACGMSERHFLTLFRRATRLPPRAFYNMLRLDAAFALLGDMSRPIAEIAYQLGFSAPPHFTRFMRANTGWTPSGYRAHVHSLPPALRPRLTLQWPGMSP
ncbi:MAG: helix-turn-helix transcriptional regulator [Burkholderiales bacterium]|nr:helix-turn-helix transcriptional regulator [Burkholderiales bacterium]